MNYLSADKIGRNIGEKWVFKDISFGVLQGERIALIGANGSGKSSLLETIAGNVIPDQGELKIRKDIRVGYLNQNPEFNTSQTVFESLFLENNETTQAIFNYEQALKSGNSDDISQAIEALDSLNAWDYEAKIKQILGKLGIHDIDKLIGELSGGQQKRVALARVLIEEPDLLILDEPTNHLDLESIEWLEGYLSSMNNTILMVTHDRYFLDKVSNSIIELRDSQLFKYQGNYAYFLEKKEAQEQVESVNLEKNRQLLKKELEWMRRQPKARTTKAQYRIDAFHDLKEKTKGPKNNGKLELSLKSERLGKKIIELQHVSKSFNSKKIINEFSYTFKRKDRIGIIGKNGSGKSTLLNIITGQIQPDQGKVIKGETIKIGYFNQDGLQFDENQKIIDFVREIADFIKLEDGREISISNFLNMFLFPPATQHKPIGVLSGGEKRRLHLLKVLASNPNFLILDEPTNDLDIETLNVLEEFLSDFQGCLMIVSHDRYFMDNLVDHVFVLEDDGKIKDFPGNYTEFRYEIQTEKKDQTPKKIEQAINQNAEVKKKLSYNEKLELENLNKELPELEQQKVALIQLMNKEEQDYMKIKEYAEKIEAISEDIELKEFRWLELSEKV